MKTRRYVWLAMLGIFAVPTAGNADPVIPDPGSNPYTEYDRDGIPLAVTRDQPKRLSQPEIDAIRRQQERAVRDKDWLLRGYEKQLQIHAAQSQDQSSNLYYQLSSDKQLAKLAGLPSMDDGSDDSGAYRTGSADSDKDSLALRSDGPSAPKSISSGFGRPFKPLITPLGAPDAAGLHNFYSFVPLSTPSPYSDVLPKTASESKPGDADDSLDIQTPGMVAAGKDPLMDSGTSDLSLDILPGESIEHARAHQDDETKLELPLPMDATQLHNAQAAALTVSGPTKVDQKPAAAPQKAIPVDDQDAPLPVSKTPPITPVRAPIANPFDILNR